ncbi:MAG: ABC transporter substrate-binding protein, partial [Methanosarcinales archaeon]|nr:ABC transporter substrate-binding protein [Methanosarcinales archaeon]
QRLAEILHPGIALEPEEAYGEYLDFMRLEEQSDRMFVFPAVD